MTYQPIEPQPPTRRKLTSLTKKAPRSPLSTATDHPPASDTPAAPPGAGETTTSAPSTPPPARRPERTTVSGVFYLPVSLAQAFSDRVKQENTTNGELALDAVEAAIEQLPQLLAKPDPRENDGLFARPRTVTTEKTTQITGYFIRSNLDTLNDLAAQHDCSRSALLTACLRAYLTR